MSHDPQWACSLSQRQQIVQLINCAGILALQVSPFKGGLSFSFMRTEESVHLLELASFLWDELSQPQHHRHCHWLVGVVGWQ